MRDHSDFGENRTLGVGWAMGWNIPKNSSGFFSVCSSVPISTRNPKPIFIVNGLFDAVWHLDASPCKKIGVKCIFGGNFPQKPLIWWVMGIFHYKLNWTKSTITKPIMNRFESNLNHLCKMTCPKGKSPKRKCWPETRWPPPPSWETIKRLYLGHLWPDFDEIWNLSTWWHVLHEKHYICDCLLETVWLLVNYT